jgi:DnaJ family protein C protein 16
MRMYMHSILDKSHTQPFLIFAYSSYCRACFMLESVWKEAVTDLEALGYGIGTANYMFDGDLFEALRITQLPSLVVVVEGRVIHYRGSFNHISAKTIRLFARDALPGTFLYRINSYLGLRRFLDQWESTNKVSVLMMGAKEEPRLRYLLTAMKYGHFVRFAYVYLNYGNKAVEEMKAHLAIRCIDCENVLVFKEEPQHGPVAKISSENRQFSTEELTQLIERQKLLTLPRLSSMEYFDQLCPVSSRGFRHFCVILPVVDSTEDAKFVDNMRNFVKQHDQLLAQERINIVYMYTNKQRSFMESFGDITLRQGRRDLLVIWRNEYVKARYSWLPSGWPSDADILHKSSESLKENLLLLNKGGIRMEKTASVTRLTDEYAPTWFSRLSRRIVRMTEVVWFHLTKDEALPILSVVGTLFFIFFVGFFLNYVMAENKNKEFKEKQPPFTTEQKEWHPDDPKVPPTKHTSKSAISAEQKAWTKMEPMIHELRAETYFGLIRLLKPGCRSIIVLVDAESKDVLLPQFARHIYPLRNNKTFSFGYLMVNKNLLWFRTLLEHTLPVDKEDPTSSTFATTMFQRLKGINPKQTLGTVLVLCGWKLYFSMYHPMHKASKAKNFVGFDDSDDVSDSDDKEIKEKIRRKELNLDNVLNGFPNFLDRLLEGSIRRYYVPEWPENLK